ncbi:YceG family protein [Halobacillus salinarum]|uniref:YceG family protein n=1 Tax=Halobacillus salinarum TaxID=2932257 RepID=A0ABY4EHP6_9BACI|nr:YceG family protein [Halobacillus salinarum]UOQ43950.1 YceG family protein [Halobacillus salinarum]
MGDYQSITIHRGPIKEDRWKDVLHHQLPERDVYEKGHTLEFTALSGRILGTSYDETEYFMMLHELYKRDSVHILNEELNKRIAPETFQAVQKILMINQEEKGLSTNRFVAFLDGEQLTPKHPNPVMNKHIRLSLMKVLDKFNSSHEKGFTDSQFRRVLVDLVKWSWNHLDVWLQEVNIEEEMPHVIWYGEASPSQLYFLYYLMLIGCDVLIFHPEAKDQFAELDGKEEISKTYKYPARTELQPFPTEEPKRQSTVAYRSSQEMDHVLHHEGSSLYKPWQFRNHIPKSVTLKTTYDELFLIAKEKAFIRPNFEVDKQMVQVPNLFAKVMGVSTNSKEYWDRIQTLTDLKETELVKKFPFTDEVNANYQFHYQDAVNEKGIIEPDQLMNTNVWRYQHLPSGTQRAMAAAISRICEKPKLLPKANESVQDVRHYLFAQATNLPPAIQHLVQTFDYSQTVPKLILYNTEMNGTLARSDAAVLLFLNEIGLDLLIYNPPGHNCIEQFIEKKEFDTHWLEEMSFGQEFKEPTFMRKFINSIIK